MGAAHILTAALCVARQWASSERSWVEDRTWRHACGALLHLVPVTTALLLRVLVTKRRTSLALCTPAPWRAMPRSACGQVPEVWGAIHRVQLLCTKYGVTVTRPPTRQLQRRWHQPHSSPPYSQPTALSPHHAYLSQLIRSTALRLCITSGVDRCAPAPRRSRRCPPWESFSCRSSPPGLVSSDAMSCR